MASQVATGPGQQIKLNDLPVAQLTQLKKQFDDELQNLTSSFQSLRQAQAKFKDCLLSLQKGVKKENEGKSILVPLTSSLYVPGKLADVDKVVVDVGTGFYVEKSVKEATTFYEGKVKELQVSLGELEKIVQGKSDNLRVVEDVMRQKIMEQNNQTGAGASSSGGGT
ncbi:Prefoldin alpha subunit [Tothia fuscella]|uniref:Prefoldin alpha subunit n=1 Tax=Tothia fuscella TaxID=1048955 RepID=A0A9P4TWX3_9PEZI|nr:Prefoldin alpha subunit [Tothia fuscella]